MSGVSKTKLRRGNTYIEDDVLAVLFLEPPISGLKLGLPVFDGSF